MTSNTEEQQEPLPASELNETNNNNESFPIIATATSKYLFDTFDKIYNLIEI